MTEEEQKQLGKTLWTIADQLRAAMNADDFRDYVLSFLFLRYLSDNYEQAAQKGLGADYPKIDPAPPRTAAPSHCWRVGTSRAPPTWWSSESRCAARCIVHLAKAQSDQRSTRCRRVSSTSRKNPPRATSRATLLCDTTRLCLPLARTCDAGAMVGR